MNRVSPFWIRAAILIFLESILIAFILTYHAEWEGGRIVRFLLMDDAMISLSYARSLVEGCGLIWHCDAQRVEGITNMGWTLYMAFWLWVGVAPAYGALPVLLTGLITAALHLLGTHAIAKKLYDEKAATLAMGTLALLPPVWIWHSTGLETGALAALLTYLLSEAISDNPRLRHAVIYLTLGTFLRMDFFLWGVAVWMLASIRRGSDSRFLLPFVAGAGVILLQTIFRKAYYGEWVPHTYLLKVADIPVLYRWLNGSLCAGFHILYNLPLWVIGGYGVWRTLSSMSWRAGAVLSAPVLISAGYSVHAGGDLEEGALISNRFMLSAMTALAVGAGYALSRIPAWMGWSGVVLIGHGIPLYPAAVAGRWRALLSPVRATLVQGWDERYRYFFFGKKPIPVHRYLPAGAKVVVGFAGTYPYFFRDYRWLDFFGKNDRSILREGSRIFCGAMPYQIYFPGHTRWGWHLVQDAAAIVEVVAFDDTLVCASRKASPLTCIIGIGGKLDVAYSCCRQPGLFPFPDTSIQRYVCGQFYSTAWGGFWLRRRADQ